MAVAIVLTGPQDTRLIHWAARLAIAREDGLILFWALKRRGETKVATCCDPEQIPDELKTACDTLYDKFQLVSSEDETDDGEDNATQEAEDAARLQLEVVTISSAAMPTDLEKEIDERIIGCLIVPRDAQLKSGTPESALHDHMLQHIPCEIVFLTPGTKETTQLCRQIVTPVGEGPHSASCLRMANQICSASNAQLVALHIEPEFDITAKQAAEQILTKTVNRALGSEQEQLTKRVILEDDVVDGIKEAVDETTDLIILGMKRSRITKRFSSHGVADRLVNSNPGPAVAIVQSAIPLSSQLGRWFDSLVSGTVPQLPRDHRVNLVERIQRSSQWDFDFVVLICLSTLIAAVGLIQDSAAVVIGAMLVAPLMTPLLGNGLSITQGNQLLFRGTIMTVLRGFLLAFFVSWCVGMLASGAIITEEMAARGNPSPLDIAVAMVGGIAAAYASGRPNLLSALPGVAIAASLVPPIATSGIAMSAGDFGLSISAAMLFFTNIVAIVLGTWIAFRAVGIRSVHEHGDFDRWTWGAGAALLILVVSLGVYESMTKQKNTQTLLQDRLNALAETDNWNCTDVEAIRVDGKKKLIVNLHSPRGMPDERMTKIRETVRDAFDNPINVEYVTTTE